MFGPRTINLRDFYDCIYDNAQLDEVIELTCGKVPFSVSGPRPGTILGVGGCRLETETFDGGFIRKAPVRWLRFTHDEGVAPYTARGVLEFLEYSMGESDVWDVLVEAAVFDWDGSWLADLIMDSRGVIEPVPSSFNTFHIQAKWYDPMASIVDPSNY